MRIGYITRALTHYRHPVLRELARRGVECRAIIAGSGRAQVESNFANLDGSFEVVDLRRAGFRWRTDVLDALEPGNWDSLVVEHGTSLDFAWTLLTTRRFAGVPRVLWTHGIDRKEYFSGAISLSGHGRWKQLRMADAVICYDEASARRLSETLTGITLGVAHNSTDGSMLLEQRQLLQAVTRADHRRSLGLARAFYLIALGRLIPAKDFARAVRVTGILRNRGFDVGIIVVGDGPDAPKIRNTARESGLREGEDILFVGARTKPPELASYLYAADACINPGCLGLAVVDCLYSGVPIITVQPGMRGPYHGPEWSNLKPDVSGWFAPEWSDESLAQTAEQYLSLPMMDRQAAERACIDHAKTSLGIGPMVEGFLETLGRVSDRG